MCGFIDGDTIGELPKEPCFVSQGYMHVKPF
jgi:hypothetical protein